MVDANAVNNPPGSIRLRQGFGGQANLLKRNAEKMGSRI
jgi:hypothetical protein